MEITVEELPDSRQWTTGENLSVEFSYQVRGTASDVEAKNALLAEAPASYQYLPRQSSQLEPVHVDEANPDKCIWKGTVRYARASQAAEPPETGESSFSFDTGGGTQHVRYAKASQAWACGSYGSVEYAYNGINVSGKAGSQTIEGVDIACPVYSFSETHYLSNETVTGGYKALLFGLTGKTNNATFRDFAAGEVLFLGASGSKRGDEDWEITFHFSASKNVDDFCADWPAAIKPAVAIPKKGWELAWTLDREFEGANGLVIKPMQIAVVRVYDSDDFSSLGIGV